jgi:hypothetical protein
MDEVEVVGGHDKTFALWPIWFRNRTGLGTTNAGRVDAALPLYYVERSPLRDHTAVMWPFFSWTDDRAGAVSAVECALAAGGFRAGRARRWTGCCRSSAWATPRPGGADLPLAAVSASASAHRVVRPGSEAVGDLPLRRSEGTEPGDGQDGAAGRLWPFFHWTGIRKARSVCRL